jgi:prepilin-type N-terminal cleavage/methylation domain-containing protein
MQKGFSVIEIVLVLLILSITITGALRLDQQAQDWLNKSQRLVNQTIIFSQANEIILAYSNSTSFCPACDCLNSTYWDTWKTNLPVSVQPTLNLIDANHIQVELCEHPECKNIIFPVSV